MKKRLTQIAIPTVLSVTPLYGLATLQHYSAVVLSAKNAYTCLNCRANKFNPIKRRSRIKQGETIITSKNGYVNLKFKDGALLKIRQNSSLKLQRFQYFNKTKDGKLNVKLLQSSNILFISGEMKKKNIKFSSHIGTVGIRGSAFDSYCTPKTCTVLNIKGEICFKHHPTAKIICIKPSAMILANLSGIQVSQAPQSILDSVESDTKALQQSGSQMSSVPANENSSSRSLTSAISTAISSNAINNNTTSSASNGSAYSGTGMSAITSGNVGAANTGSTANTANTASTANTANTGNSNAGNGSTRLAIASVALTTNSDDS